MSIMDKLKKNSKIKETSTLSTSKFFTEKDMVPTDVPMLTSHCRDQSMVVSLRA